MVYPLIIVLGTGLVLPKKTKWSSFSLPALPAGPLLCSQNHRSRRLSSSSILSFVSKKSSKLSPPRPARHPVPQNFFRSSVPGAKSPLKNRRLPSEVLPQKSCRDFVILAGLDIFPSSRSKKWGCIGFSPYSESRMFLGLPSSYSCSPMGRGVGGQMPVRFFIF